MLQPDAMARPQILAYRGDEGIDARITAPGMPLDGLPPSALDNGLPVRGPGRLSVDRGDRAGKKRAGQQNGSDQGPHPQGPQPTCTTGRGVGRPTVPETSDITAVA